MNRRRLFVAVRQYAHSHHAAPLLASKVISRNRVACGLVDRQGGPKDVSANIFPFLRTLWQAFNVVLTNITKHAGTMYSSLFEERSG